MAFASRSLREHLVRGAIGFAGLVLAIHIAAPHPWLSLLVAIVALVAFRGCPVCWLTGLIETMAMGVLSRHEKPGP